MIEKYLYQNKAEKDLRDFSQLNHKVIVLDDDPTGTQTVKDLMVLTSFEKETIKEGFLSENNMFFILTNSRALNKNETEKLHKELIQKIDYVSDELGIDYILISRGDSTLRGHFYHEPEIINRYSKNSFDGLFYIPAFFEGDRYTFEGIHYIKEDQVFIPVSNTEFSKDTTFGFEAQNMSDFVQEKSNNKVSASEVVLLDIHTLRSRNEKVIFNILDSITSFKPVVVDALTENDLNWFTAMLMKYLNKCSKRFLFRTAASFVKSISETPGTIINLKKYDLNNNGGLIVIGSHVNKTSEQLDELRKTDIKALEFDVTKVIDKTTLETYVNDFKKIVESFISKGQNVVIFTTRTVIKTTDKEKNLKISKEISKSLVYIVSELRVKPRFIIAKGGITSSDIATIGLKIKKATVLGQADQGIPVWLTGNEAKYSKIPYIIFPGNVGNKYTLKELYQKLK